MKNNQSNSDLQLIDLYDIFDLMDLSNLRGEDKKKYLEKIQGVIVNEFLYEVLSTTKDEKLIGELNKKVSAKEPPTHIYEYLSQSIPLFSEKLFDFVRFRKKQYIVEYYDNLVESLDKKLFAVDKMKQAVKIKKDLKFYIGAQVLARNGQWGELKIHLSGKGKS